MGNRLQQCLALTFDPSQSLCFIMVDCSDGRMTAVLFVPARSGGPANPGGLQFFCLISLVLFFISHLYKSGGMCSPYEDERKEPLYIDVSHS